jgi:hypothetical protein
MKKSALAIGTIILGAGLAVHSATALADVVYTDGNFASGNYVLSPAFSSNGAVGTVSLCPTCGTAGGAGAQVNVSAPPLPPGTMSCTRFRKHLTRCLRNRVQLMES